MGMALMASTDLSAPPGRFPPGRLAFPHRDLTGIGKLARHEILYLLSEAEQWVALNRQSAKHTDLLAGLTIINAFFENSTRTLLSFEIAGKRLGADVVNMHAAQSSVKKGETLIDTAITLNAMRADAIVIRHGSSGATGLIADKVDCPVLNAGDGQHEHPTQALLDALTLRHALAERAEGAEDFTGLKVVICGDILHSRVARSNILCLTAFGARVAQLAGDDPWSKRPGAYASSNLSAYLADLGQVRKGKAIGVVTIAGEIVDGEAGPGIAGGTRIADLLDEALDDDLAALVVRVDSPGGSVSASEEIRRAIQRFRDRKIPVAVSMGNLAASGGYWVAMSSDRVFAEPETITGSIGVYAVIPTFENAAARLGVTADGYRTTELSGQPDFVGGFSPAMDTLLQTSIGGTYQDFLKLVSGARRLPVERVDQIAQGQVWDGGTARQIGLVDEFGGLTEALEWAAAKAGTKKGEWHAVYLGEQDANYDSLIRQLVASETAKARSTPMGDIFAMTALRSEALGTRITRDAKRLLGTRGVQAYCLDCPSPLTAPAAASPAAASARFEGMLALLTWLAGS